MAMLVLRHAELHLLDTSHFISHQEIEQRRRKTTAATTTWEQVDTSSWSMVRRSHGSARILTATKAMNPWNDQRGGCVFLVWLSSDSLGGIRCLDLRLRLDNGLFSLHDKHKTKMPIITATHKVESFLSENPDEFILLDFYRSLET
jgi:hypothetical protein